MPIADYTKRARKAEKRLFENPNIPDTTKRILQRFLISYDVSDARKIIFVEKIRPLLIEFDPIESALSERDNINQFFANIRNHYSHSTYVTYFKVSQRFLTWLNDGEKPSSLKDIKPGKSAKSKRNLKPEDMVSWKDGQLISNATLSIQIKAAVQSQLDCGFRPSEFIDLRYGDVEVHKGLLVFHVQDGKTGPRTVVAQRCVPAMLKWLENHPTKNAYDPLWIQEHNILESKSGKLSVTPYPYSALAKRVKEIGQKAGIIKPLDFYNFRHSSCVLDKADNLPVDLAAERHGHSVKEFVGTYGRLSIKDVVHRFKSHYGTDDTEPVKLMQHQTCPACKTVNTETQNWCSACGTPLNTSGAIESAKNHGLLQSKEDLATRDELKHLKAELSASRRREDSFRKEQMLLLKQVEDIRSVLGEHFPSG